MINMNVDKRESDTLTPPDSTPLQILDTLTPPDPTPLQTLQQKRRSLPKRRLVSQLKKKPRYKEKLAAQQLANGEVQSKPSISFFDDQSDRYEVVPLVRKLNRESGDDYYIDPKYLVVEPKKVKPPAPDQIKEEKLKSEIVSPYKNNWILVIAGAILAIVSFATIFPDALNTPTINFPQEL